MTMSRWFWCLRFRSCLLTSKQLNVIVVILLVLTAFYLINKSIFNTVSVRNLQFVSIENRFAENVQNTTRPLCPRPVFSGQVLQAVNSTVLPMEQLEKHFPDVKEGGHWEPDHCAQRQHLAILIPLRDRWDQLPVLVRHIHQLLSKQWRHYTVFVIEQLDGAPFNRGKLLNIGATEAVKLEPDVNCFILHDVDTVPQSLRTLYKCHEDRRLALQMATYQKKRNYRIAYKGYTGGVLAVWRDQYEAINGFSNEFWGWGGEDDDFGNRLRGKAYDVARDFSRRSASFYSLDHPPVPANPHREAIIRNHKQDLYREGLNTTEYRLIKLKRHRLFTLISVRID